MDIVNFLLLLVVLYLIQSSKTSLHSKIHDLEIKILGLQELIKKQTFPPKVSEAVKSEDVPQKPIPPVVEQKPPAPIESKREVLEEDFIAPKREVQKEVETPSYTTPPQPRKVIPREEPEPELSFFERYPDLEKFIGENLANKIGIAILVLSIGYFVKYAIDSNWIGPVGRVAIGVLCGGILIGFAHQMRNSYKAFSSVLVGGGLAVLYFTITLAYHQFHLFSQLIAFSILVLITAFAVALSLLYNRQELAVIALVGGLVSPFMVSSGNANYHGLFIYLLILNTGLLIIAYFKTWRILNITSFALTVIVFSGIMYTLTEANYHIGFIYASVFYLLFFAVNIANNVRENKQFIAADFTILLVNTALYFSAGLYLLTEMHLESFRGLFTAALALVNLVLSYILFRNRKVDTNVLYLLIGITLTFISLTAPIQLKGNYITLFWASEAVLLYWLYLKSGIKLTKLSALIVWGAMLISLLMDWSDIYSSSGTVLAVIINKGFITSIYAAIASYLLYLLIRKDPSEEHFYGIDVPAKPFLVVSVILLFLAGLLEVNHQFLSRFPGTNLYLLYVLLYIQAFVFLFLVLSGRTKSLYVPWWIKATISGISILVYFSYTSVNFDMLRSLLEVYPNLRFHFIAHWAAAIFTGLLIYQLILLRKSELEDSNHATASWVLSLVVVLFLSFEVSLLADVIFYSKSTSLDYIHTVYIKTGLPVLWGLSSFAMMWLGMKRRFKPLRIISLSLFSLTLLKLFLFDIRNIPAAGKIAAFFCLGILLLSISFMYQKVKQIIIADEDEGHV